MSIKGVDEFADDVIRTRKKEPTSLLNSNDEIYLDKKQIKSDLLTVFMGLKDEKGEAPSEKFLRDVCDE
ncbi:hypothetical protein ACFX2C_028523 [Malus domestica]